MRVKPLRQKYLVRHDGRTRERVYEIMPHGPDLTVDAAGPIEAVKVVAQRDRNKVIVNP